MRALGSISLRWRQRSGSALHDLYPHSQLQQDVGEVVRDAAAADDEGGVEPGGVAAQQTEKGGQTGRLAHQVEPVPRLGNKGAVRDDDTRRPPAPPRTGAQGRARILLVWADRGWSRHKVLLPYPEAHQLHPAPAEGLHIGGSWGKRSSREISTAVAFSGLMAMSMPSVLLDAGTAPQRIPRCVPGQW